MWDIHIGPCGIRGTLVGKGANRTCLPSLHSGESGVQLRPADAIAPDSPECSGELHPQLHPTPRTMLVRTPQQLPALDDRRLALARIVERDSRSAPHSAPRHSNLHTPPTPQISPLTAPLHSAPALHSAQLGTTPLRHKDHPRRTTDSRDRGRTKGRGARRDVRDGLTM